MDSASHTCFLRAPDRLPSLSRPGLRDDRVSFDWTAVPEGERPAYSPPDRFDADPGSKSLCGGVGGFAAFLCVSSGPVVADTKAERLSSRGRPETKDVPGLPALAPAENSAILLRDRRSAGVHDSPDGLAFRDHSHYRAPEQSSVPACGMGAVLSGADVCGGGTGVFSAGRAPGDTGRVSVPLDSAGIGLAGADTGARGLSEQSLSEILAALHLRPVCRGLSVPGHAAAEVRSGRGRWRA